jgi:hypothetical protein
MVKISTPQTGELEQTAELSDFRDVDCVKVRSASASRTPCRNISMTFSKVENNVRSTTSYS